MSKENERHQHGARAKENTSNVARRHLIQPGQPAKLRHLKTPTAHPRYPLPPSISPQALALAGGGVYEPWGSDKYS